MSRSPASVEPLRLFIATEATGKRIATTRGDRLLDFRVVEDAERPLIGQINLGRIARLERGLDAAFVDCGGGETGFLPLHDGPSGITEGQRLIVQVIREPFDGKTMRLTARPVLTAYRLSYAPFSKGPVFPEGMTDAEKLKLQRSLDTLGDARRGINPRSAALGTEPARLHEEAERLRSQWKAILSKADRGREAMLLRPAPGVLADLVRDCGPSLAEIICDTRTTAARIATLCQSVDDSLVQRVEFRPRRKWVPSVEELEEQVDEALSSEVALQSGAALRFAETQAMAVIDVDSGQARLDAVGAKAERSFLKINLDAAQEIARQIRLRDLAGIIVIDFIDLRARDLRQRVLDALRTAVAADTQPVWVGGMSRLALVELTRQRRSPTLAERLLESCKTCGSRHRLPNEALWPWFGRGR